MNGYVAHCGNCNAWTRQAPMKPDGFCRARPPQMVVMVQKAATMPGQQPQMVQVPQSVFPPIADIGWCREHEPAKAAPIIADKEDLPEIDFTKLELQPAEGSAD